MIITHKTRTQEETGRGSALFMLTNRKGGYLFLGDHNFSHYTGLTFMMPGEWTLFKTIDDIILDAPVDRLVNKYYGVERGSGDAVEQFRLFNKTLYYQVDNYIGGITLDLDMRRIYDFSDDGRIYKIYYEDNVIVVEYDRHGDRAYLIISGTDHFTLLNSWEHRSYAYDASRSQRPEGWVYRALRLECNGSQRLAFTFGLEKEAAKKEASVAWNDWDLIRNRMKQHARSIRTDNGVAYSTAVFALESCLCSINHDQNRTGVFAGYPWFFHFWARDELISLQGLVLAEKYQLVKDILYQYALQLLPDGRLPNTFPAVARGSADAVLWLWKRYADFITVLEDRKLLWEYFSFEELEAVLSSLQDALRKLRASHERDGLIQNASQETWMDTLGLVDDRREGARIEIQALTLASLRFVSVLNRILKKGNGREFKTWEKELRERVRRSFFVDGMLFDGIVDGVLDRTIRPNLFIAAYAYPDLLSKKEWSEVFDLALKALWLPWGGLSSIDKSHPWFCPHYDAKSERSYHRGDSWYWVNNLAAVAMRRIAPESFGFHIERVRQASVDELLWSGVVGQCAEVSSAAEKTSSGCFAQAWSAATLVELLHELNTN